MVHLVQQVEWGLQCLVWELLCQDRSKSSAGAPLTLLWEPAGNRSWSAQTKTCWSHMDFFRKCSLNGLFYHRFFLLCSAPLIACIVFLWTSTRTIGPVVSRYGAVFPNLFRFVSSPLSSPFLTCLRLTCLGHGAHSQSILGTLHRQWSWGSWACIWRYFSGNSRKPLRGLCLGPARQTRSFLVTGSSSLSRLLRLLSAASPGGLRHCGVLPGPSPPQPPYMQPEAGCVVPQIWDTHSWLFGFS